jgi:O-antigen ligase
MLRVAWVCALGILFPLLLFHRALIDVGISDLILVPAILLGIRRGEWRRWWELRRDPLPRWVLGFAASVIIGLIVARLRLGYVSAWALVNRGLGLAVPMGIYCLFATAPRRQVWFYLRWFVLAGSLLNLFALAAVVLRYAYDSGSVFFFAHTSLRLSGLMHNPNAYGGFLAALLSVQLAAVAFGESLFGRVWMDAANIVALLLASLFTISRGSWLATLAGALAVMVAARAARRTVPRRMHWVAPAGVAVCIAGFLLITRIGGLFPVLRHNLPQHALDDTSGIYFPRGAASFSEFLRIARDPAGAGDRLAILRAAVQLYTASPSTMLFGLGLGGFAEAAPTTSLGSSVIIHNSFVWALVELGPLGALCMLGVFLSALWQLWRSLRSDAEGNPASAALLAALITVLVWCMSNDGAYQRHLWFLLGLATTAAAAGGLKPAPAKFAAEISSKDDSRSSSGPSRSSAASMFPMRRGGHPDRRQLTATPRSNPES